MARGGCRRHFLFVKEKMKPGKLVLTVLALFIACGQAFSVPLDEATVARSDVVATYKSEVVSNGKAQTTTWTLRRSADRIEMREREHDTGEIWRRDQGGNISFERVFHKQRRIVDYTPADLRSLESYPAWQRISEIVDAQLFGNALKRVSSPRVLGKTAERYKGRIGELGIEIVWLPNERLPYKVKQQSRNRRTELTLTRLAPLNDSRESDPTSSYTRLDYADLGDGPSDPFFKQLSEHAEHKH